jgi:hypothetical protein
MLLRKILLISPLAGIALQSSAYQLDCPATVAVPTASVALATPHPGWQASTREARLELDGAFLSSGRPAQFADLKPEPYVVNGQRYEWRIARADHAGEGIWFSCRYNGGQILLSQPIDATVAHCRTVAHTTQHRLSITLECQ